MQNFFNSSIRQGSFTRPISLCDFAMRFGNLFTNPLLETRQNKTITSVW
jgi:hypothetical protein